MLLCGVLHTALSVSFGAIVQIVIFVLQNSNILRVQASLPPGAEDEIILIEHLPGRRVHLQDFFWTDVKDAPPWVDSTQGLIFYETKTIHHTVTLHSPVQDEGNQEPVFPHTTKSNDPKCTTCIEPTPRLDDDEDQNIGILIGEDPGPRYWLLTVLRAGETVPPKIELKLARLYQTAFSRQQQRHLGLLQAETRLRRVTREQVSLVKKPENTNQEEIVDDSKLSSSKMMVETYSGSQVPTISKPIQMAGVTKFQNFLPASPDVNDKLIIGNHSKKVQMEAFQLKKLNYVKKRVLLSKDMSTSTMLVGFNDSTTDFMNMTYSQNNASLRASSTMRNLQNFSENHSTSEKLIVNNIDTRSTISNKHSELRSLDYIHGETVQVRMQNTTVTEAGATKLIYSVHLGGKPVPAETAARDMALLSPQEVALELGAPVIIQSEPFLRETHPLALSRKRDAWLLIGAASAGFILLALVVLGLIIAAKRKRAHSAVAAPPNQNILKKKREYIQATAGLDNAFSTSEMEVKTDGTSQRLTPRTLSRTPASLETADSLEEEIHEVSSDNDDQKRQASDCSPWKQASRKTKLIHARMSRTNAIDSPRSSVSTNLITDHLEVLDSLENNYDGLIKTRHEDASASPHSYLSMPSCKQFPSMKSVEPLSRVLEPVMVKHLDIESPELLRRENDNLDIYKSDGVNNKVFSRTSSAIQDPGVVGPIVWNLRAQHLPEGNATSGTDVDSAYVAPPSGPVGRARRRLHELLEDSFSLFGSRDPRSEIRYVTRPNSATYAPDFVTVLSETNRRSVHASPISSPTTNMIGRLCKSTERSVTENGHSMPFRSRNNWGPRPLSAGPFHRPNLPDIDTRRVLTDCQLSPEDPAVPLIASIKKELEKFSPK